MKHPREDEPSKARRGWQLGRGRPAPSGDGSPAATKPKRSSRSVFGPSGDERPDVLTDAETVVLPIWLHHRPASADKAAPESAATLLKTITVPAQPGEATVTEPETGERPATGPETEAGETPEAKDGVEAASGATDAGTSARPAGDPATQDPEAQPAESQSPEGQSAEGESPKGQSAEGESAEGESAEGESPKGQSAEGAEVLPGERPRADATQDGDEQAEATDAEADADAKIKPGAGTKRRARAQARALARTDARARRKARGKAGPEPEAGAEAGVEAGASTATQVEDGAEVKAAAGAGAAEVADGGSAAEGDDVADAPTGTKAEEGPGGGPQTGEDAGPEADGGTAGAKVAAAGTASGPVAAPVTGPHAATRPGGSGPDSAETIATFSLADLKAALETTTVPPPTASATTGPATTVQLKPVPAGTAQAKAVEVIEAMDDLEARTIDGLEARTVEALETVVTLEAIEAKTTEAMRSIEALTAEALQAIDATAAEIAGTVTVLPGQPETTQPETTQPETTQPETTGTGSTQPRPAEPETAGPEPAKPDTSLPGQAEPAQPDHAADAQPDRASAASSGSGTDVARAHVISIDEPPASVTLSTSATETTIALPKPRRESVVAVTPAPADTATLTPVPQRGRFRRPAALPPAEPSVPSAEPSVPAEPEADPAYVTTWRRTRVSRALLLCILCLQAIMSLRLHNTAFEDESLYIYSGHMELEHLLHGAALQGQYAAYFSGSPVLYPLAAGFLDGLGGLRAARMLSLAEMLSITVLLYALTRRLFNERIALCAAVLFSVCESAIFLGNFATYDATCLFLLALSAWIVVRTAGSRWPVFLMAAPVAALAVGVKYAGLLFVPTVAVLPALAGWPLRGRRVLLYPPAFVVAVAGLLYGALHLGGKAYMTAISSTTTNRAQGATPVTTLLRESAEWGGVIFVLALIGTAVYVWRARTEPEEILAPPGSRFRRLCLGVILTGTALLAPAYQAHLHTDISFQKHIGFGLFFAAPIAGVGLARILGDHFRRPHIAVGIWSLALVLGLVQSAHLYQVWPNSTQFVRAFSRYLQPHARYLVEVPEVPIYYLLGHPDAQPSQFTSTFYINYFNSKGVLLTGTVGFTAAVDAGYFHVVAYDDEVTAAADAVLAQALSVSRDYYLASEIQINDVFGPGDYFIWVKGHRPTPTGVFVHASPRYQDLGTKLRELAP